MVPQCNLQCHIVQDIGLQQPWANEPYLSPLQLPSNLSLAVFLAQRQTPQEFYSIGISSSHAYTVDSQRSLSRGEPAGNQESRERQIHLEYFVLTDLSQCFCTRYLDPCSTFMQCWGKFEVKSVIHTWAVDPSSTAGGLIRYTRTKRKISQNSPCNK